MSESSSTSDRDQATGTASSETEEQTAPVTPAPTLPVTGTDLPDEPPNGFEPV